MSAITDRKEVPLAKWQPFEIRVKMGRGELEVEKLPIDEIHNLINTGFDYAPFFARLTSNQFQCLQFSLLSKRQFLQIVPGEDSDESRKKIALIPIETINLYLSSLPDLVFQHLTDSQISALKIAPLTEHHIDLLFPLHDSSLYGRRFRLLSKGKLRCLIKKIQFSPAPQKSGS